MRNVGYILEQLPEFPEPYLVYDQRQKNGDGKTYQHLKNTQEKGIPYQIPKIVGIEKLFEVQTPDPGAFYYPQAREKPESTGLQFPYRRTQR
jgi:hypothetical protein